MSKMEFWNHLLVRRDAIAAIDPGAADAREQLLAQLSAIDECFQRCFDPADHFEEYVTVSLCQALVAALKAQKAP